MQEGFIHPLAADYRSRLGSSPRPTTNKYNMQSPCKKICKIENDICLGCNRTLYEVVAWPRLTDEQRHNIMETLDDPGRIPYQPKQTRSVRPNRANG